MIPYRNQTSTLRWNTNAFRFLFTHRSEYFDCEAVSLESNTSVGGPSPPGKIFFPPHGKIDRPADGGTGVCPDVSVGIPTLCREIIAYPLFLSWRGSCQNQNFTLRLGGLTSLKLAARIPKYPRVVACLVFKRERAA